MTSIELLIEQITLEFKKYLICINGCARTLENRWLEIAAPRRLRKKSILRIANIENNVLPTKSVAAKIPSNPTWTWIVWFSIRRYSKIWVILGLGELDLTPLTPIAPIRPIIATAMRSSNDNTICKTTINESLLRSARSSTLMLRPRVLSEIFARKLSN